MPQFQMGYVHGEGGDESECDKMKSKRDGEREQEKNWLKTTHRLPHIALTLAEARIKER